MSRVMGLDPATKTGWGSYDTDKPMSAIVSGSFVTGDPNDDVFTRIDVIRQTFPKILRDQKPDFVAIETPFMFLPRFKKTTKAPGMLAGVDQSAEEETGMNPRTISMLGSIYGAVVMIVKGYNIPCCPVNPKTWQTLVSAYHGKPKQKVAQFCNDFKIVSPNIDSRDACVIAIWASSHSQELKLLERGRVA